MDPKIEQSRSTTPPQLSKDFARIGLSFPLLAHAVTQKPAVIKFADTNNSVSIEYPRPGPAPENPALEGFDKIVFRVERECTATQADIRAKFLNNFRMDTDAARAFWQFFEAIREAALCLNNTVFMYPVVPTHKIGANPLVRRGLRRNKINVIGNVQKN